MIRSSLLLILALVLTGAIYLTGFGGSLDSRMGDSLMRQRGVRSTSAPVVYLRIDEASVAQVAPLPWDLPTARRVFSTLRDRGASKVVLAASDSLVLRDAEPLRELDWLIVPHSRNTSGAPRAMQVTLPDRDGITRRLYAWSHFPGVAGYAWQYELLGRQPDQESVRVNFVGPPNSIGNLSLADVLRGSAPGDFVRDKIVVVGIDLPDLTRWVNVPVSDFFNPMSEGEFQAQALITLLEDREIRSLPPLGNFLLLLGLLLLLWLALLPTTIRGNLIVSALSLLLVLGGSALMFLVFATLLPVTGMIVLISLVFVTSSERKARLIQQRTLQIANTSSWELTLRPLAADRLGLSPNKLWQKLAGFMDLHINPQSMFLAQLNRTGGRIQITHQFAASESDIREKRRDLARAPYSVAIDRSAAHAVEGFMYDTNLVTILVPLFYPAALTGFWIVNVTSDRDVEQVRRSLELVGKQVARQLYYAQITPSRRERMAANGMDIIQRQLERIDRVFSNLIEEKVIYHSVLDSMGSGAAIADIFGRLLFLNTPLKNHLRDKGLRVEEAASITALLDMLGAKTPGENGNWLLGLSEKSSEVKLAGASTVTTVRLVSRSQDAEGAMPEGYLLLVDMKRDTTAPSLTAGLNGPADNAGDA